MEKNIPCWGAIQMNISKVNYEYSFRIFRNGMNIRMNIQYINKWGLNILKNIQNLNEYHFNIYLNIQRHLKWREYLFNFFFNIHCHFKWRWIYRTLVIQFIHEYSYEYSSGYDPQMAGPSQASKKKSSHTLCRSPTNKPQPSMHSDGWWLTSTPSAFSSRAPVYNDLATW